MLSNFVFNRLFKLLFKSLRDPWFNMALYRLFLDLGERIDEIISKLICYISMLLLQTQVKVLFKVVKIMILKLLDLFILDGFHLVIRHTLKRYDFLLVLLSVIKSSMDFRFRSNMRRSCIRVKVFLTCKRYVLINRFFDFLVFHMLLLLHLKFTCFLFSFKFIWLLFEFFFNGMLSFFEVAIFLLDLLPLFLL